LRNKLRRGTHSDEHKKSLKSLNLDAVQRGIIILAGLLEAIGILAIGTAVLVLILQAFFRFKIRPFVIFFFVLFLFSSISKIVSTLLVPAPLLQAVGSFWTPFAFAFVLLHCSRSLGFKKTIVFFSIALSFGLVAETLGAARGLIFGPYFYTYEKFFFGLVPLYTPFGWAVIIYIAYALTNQFLFGLIGENPRLNVTRLSSAGLIIILSAIGGMVAMNLDMILDPVAVTPQPPGWVWIGGGPYSHIPISNFIGWFFVTFFAVALFRSYEAFNSKSLVGARSIDVYVPVVYLIYFFIHASLAIQMGHPEFALIGFSTMVPFVLFATLVLYIHNIRRRARK
jgi:uncharacterized membrane protein